MFEKEAEEYRSHNTNYYDWEDFSVDDGEEIEEAYLAGAEFAYNKANEWHFVKNGDLPPLRKEVLWRVDEQLWLGELLETRIDFGEWELDSVLFNDYEITWKEIELPTEIKEK